MSQISHVLRHRHTERAAVRVVRAGVPAQSNTPQSREKHIRGTKQSRVPRDENHDRGEGAAQMREMRCLSAGSGLRRGSKSTFVCEDASI